MQLRKSSFYFSLLLLIASCTTPKAIEKQMQTDKGKEAGTENFVVMKTGEKRYGTKVASPHLGNHMNDRVIVDGVVIPATEVHGYQNKDGYWAMKHSKKPTRWYKGSWIQRVRQGKMNLYVEYHRGGPQGGGSSDLYFYEMEPGKFELVTYESFSTILASKPSALKVFQDLYPKHKIKDYDIMGNAENLPRVVEIFNN